MSAVHFAERCLTVQQIADAGGFRLRGSDDVVFNLSRVGASLFLQRTRASVPGPAVDIGDLPAVGLGTEAGPWLVQTILYRAGEGIVRDLFDKWLAIGAFTLNAYRLAIAVIWEMCESPVLACPPPWWVDRLRLAEFASSFDLPSVLYRASHKRGGRSLAWTPDRSLAEVYAYRRARRDSLSGQVYIFETPTPASVLHAFRHGDYRRAVSRHDGPVDHIAEVLVDPNDLGELRVAGVITGAWPDGLRTRWAEGFTALPSPEGVYVL